MPPAIFRSEGVTLAELPEYLGRDFVTSHCFDSSADVASFLRRNIHAEDDCAQDLLINITEVTSSYVWEKNHKYNLAEYAVTATDSRCGAGENWSVSKHFLVKVFDEYN